VHHNSNASRSNSVRRSSSNRTMPRDRSITGKTFVKQKPRLFNGRGFVFNYVE
jgi:hypothetical protein